MAQRDVELMQEWLKYRKDMEGKPYAGDGVWDFWFSKLEEDRERLAKEVEKLKETTPTEFDDSIHPIIVERVNAKLDDVLNLINQEK